MKKNNLWLGVSLLMVVALVLPSCAPAAVTPTEAIPSLANQILPNPTETLQPAPNAVPKPEGTVVIRLDSAYEEGFIPWIGSGSQYRIWEIVYDYLIYTKMDGTNIGGLAERWEESADALTVTAWLRKGIQWQGGWGEVTAEDVKYTYDQLMSEGSMNSRASTLRDSIESIEIVDRYTITWHLKAANPAWWQNLTDIGYSQGPIVCKNYIEKVGELEASVQPIGSGPYRLVEHQFGDYLKFEALDEHWRVVPEFKYLIIKIVPEDSTAVAMLKTGALDATTVSSSERPELENAGFGVSTVPGGDAVSFVFGGMTSPLDDRYVEGYDQQDPWTDVRVREAMSIAIDRQAIIDALYFGAATPIPVSWLVPGWKDLEPVPYDPVRAKQLLAEAGFPNGFSFQILTPPIEPAFSKLAEAVAGYWEEIGLKPEIVIVDKAVVNTEYIYPQKTAGYVYPAANSFRTDYSTNMVSRFTYNGKNSYYQDPEIQALFDKLVPETDWVKRNELWGEIAKYLHDNYITVPIGDIGATWAFSSKIEKMSPMLSNELGNFEYLRHAQPLNTFRLFDLE